MWAAIYTLYLVIYCILYLRCKLTKKHLLDFHLEQCVRMWNWNVTLIRSALTVLTPLALLFILLLAPRSCCVLLLMFWLTRLIHSKRGKMYYMAFYFFSGNSTVPPIGGHYHLICFQTPLETLCSASSAHATLRFDFCLLSDGIKIKTLRMVFFKSWSVYIKLAIE